MAYVGRIKIKRLSNKNLLLFNEDNTLIKFTLNNVFLKFGIEKYNNNHILNIYVNKNDDNNEYNKIIDIVGIESKVKNTQKSIIDSRRYNIEGKGYKSSLTDIKEYGKDITSVRTYMNHNAEILFPGAFCSVGFDSDISGYIADIEITVKNVWITDNNFGLIIYTDKIKLIKKSSS
jgi:hypothetical protein